MTSQAAQCNSRRNLFATLLAAPFTALSLWAADPASLSDGF